MAVLSAGDEIRLTPAGVVGRVVRHIATGGEGEVHELRLPGGHAFALKWYGTRAPAGRREALQLLVDRGPPSPSFLWPLEMAEAREQPGFGYVMRLRPPGYLPLTALMRERVEPGFRSLVTAGIRLVIGFHELHSAGLCYRDISFGNVFFEPDGGDVLICDNDNVGIDGRTASTIMGTARFIAPEVVRGEAVPSAATDRYSLAVLLFYLLHLHHPLHGRRELDHAIWDDAADYEMFGGDPRFVFDPEDDRNAPIPGEHDQVLLYWSLYPAFLRHLFTRAFTLGLHDPHRRVGESEWRQALLRLRDLLTVCDACDAELFFDPDRGEGPICWHCGEITEVPLRLRIDERHEVVLTDQATVAAYLVDRVRHGGYDEVEGTVDRHPEDGRLGLRNAGENTWVAQVAGGSGQYIAPGRTVGLRPGLQIRFPRASAEVVR